ncbi:MAG: hypothetical protein IJO19_03260, partial [Clostridia bacterium]|nr:hypothetical protein [Clostridia bacterium]
TYDDNGNVIPLSERFKEDNKDIRYSLEKGKSTENKELGEALYVINKQAKVYRDTQNALADFIYKSEPISSKETKVINDYLKSIDNRLEFEGKEVRAYDNFDDYAYNEEELESAVKDFEVGSSIARNNGIWVDDYDEEWTKEEADERYNQLWKLQRILDEHSNLKSLISDLKQEKLNLYNLKHDVLTKSNVSPLEYHQFKNEDGARPYYQIGDFGFHGEIDENYNGDVKNIDVDKISSENKLADTMTFDEAKEVVNKYLDNNVSFSVENGKYSLEKGRDYLDVDENDEVTYIPRKEIETKKEYGVIDKRQLQAKAETLLKDFNSVLPVADVANELSRIYQNIRYVDPKGNKAEGRIKALAENIYNNIVNEKQSNTDKKAFAEEVSGYGIKITDSMRSEFGSDWVDFVRRYGRVFNLTKNGNGGVDVAYEDLIKKYGIEDNAKGPKEQLEAIANYYDGLGYDTFIEDNKQEIVDEIVRRIYNDYYSQDFIAKNSEKGKAQEKYKFSDNEQYIDDSEFDKTKYKEEMRRDINLKSKEYVAFSLLRARPSTPN